MGIYASADTAVDSFAYKVTKRSYSAIWYIILLVRDCTVTRKSGRMEVLPELTIGNIEFYLKIFKGLFKTSKSIIPFRSFLASSSLLTSEHCNTETEQIELPPH